MGFCYEQGFSMKGWGTKAPKFYNLLHEFGWTPLEEAPPSGVSSWVREFYDIIPGMLWGDPKPDHFP